MLNQNIINKVIKDLYDFPESKLSSLIDYIAFLKKEHSKKGEIRKKTQFMSFAGILNESEADELIQTIQKSRSDKNLEITLFYAER
jgi:hypothetical protein